MKSIFLRLIALFAIALFLVAVAPAKDSPNQVIGINVLLRTAPTAAIVADLGKYGKVHDIVPEINALTMGVPAGLLPTIQHLPYVAAANPDAERGDAPVNVALVANFDGGYSTWDLDSINVTTGPGAGTRAVAYDGTGVYVAVLDTGLVDDWRHYFYSDRIATDYARSFSGGGAYGAGNVAEQPNKWEHDQNSHGTHVTSTILGYAFGVNPINGVAPNATVIPVKVLNQNGRGWSSVIARGIVYVGDLKAGALAASPVVINMSLGGSRLDAMEKAAIDYAISKGVIVVASAGNNGNRGMGYPGGYAPVISVAASGWIGEWTTATWWYGANVPDPNDAANFYIASFSSREKEGQELDVAAPGSWVLGPYQVNSGQLSYYYLGGTSMASPHVAGVVALLAQKDPTIDAATAESTLKSTALPIPPGCATVINTGYVCWGTGYDPATSLSAAGSGMVQADAALNALP